MFTFNITAPMTEGTYKIGARMVQDGVTFFGDTFRKNIAVTTSPPDMAVADASTDDAGSGGGGAGGGGGGGGSGGGDGCSCSIGARYGSAAALPGLLVAALLVAFRAIRLRRSKKP
jgi:hypothetical protein